MWDCGLRRNRGGACGGELDSHGAGAISNHSRIEEARRTFERMMAYAYYRVAMTINIMVFIVLAWCCLTFRR